MKKEEKHETVGFRFFNSNAIAWIDFYSRAANVLSFLFFSFPFLFDSIQ